MPRTGITREQVFEIADRLSNSGISPTSQVVRNGLGKGSFTTINRHLSEWKELKWKLESDLPPISQALESRASSLIKEIWNLASEEAKKQVEQIRQAALDDISELQDQIQEAMLRLKLSNEEKLKLSYEYGEAKKVIQQLINEISGLDKALKETRRELCLLQNSMAAGKERY
ncbi:MAG: DNA-binding protein [Proteobacteria bacterium]|nr:DNA-binding protein [Pseudomonadota bacterium]MDE3207247.1 DNA-binding protein [Pseudomonadota bacterium]